MSENTEYTIEDQSEDPESADYQPVISNPDDVPNPPMVIPEDVDDEELAMSVFEQVTLISDSSEGVSMVLETDGIVYKSKEVRTEEQLNIDVRKARIIMSDGSTQVIERGYISEYSVVDGTMTFSIDDLGLNGVAIENLQAAMVALVAQLGDKVPDPEQILNLVWGHR